MFDNGFIKIHRNILKWEWYDDLNTKTLFLHLLLTVNFKPGRWQGKDVPVGSIITSIGKLAQQTNLSVQSVRTAILHLKSTGEITSVSTPQYTIITISNYKKYQETTSQITNKQQTSNKRLTNDQQQYKKEKKEKKDKKEREYTFLAPSLNKIQSIISKNQLNVNAQKFFEYYNNHDWKNKNGEYINILNYLQMWSDREKRPAQTQNIQNGYSGIKNLADVDD